MIRRILVPLDPTPYSESAVELAISTAKLYDAEVTGLVVLDIPGIKSHIGPVPPGVSFYAKELHHAKIDAAKVHIQNLLSKFEAACKKAGVEYSKSDAQGSPSKQISEISKFYDLLIMGLRTNFDFETSEESIITLDKVLDLSVTPIFAVCECESPLDFSGKNKIKTVVSYNGSLPATRALQHFAQLSFPKDKLDVRIIMADAEDKEKGKAFVLNAQKYLFSHGIDDVDTYVTSHDKIEVFGKELLNSSDLIVLGAHSKMGIFDFFAGSLARHLINENKTNLLISQ